VYVSVLPSIKSSSSSSLLDIFATRLRKVVVVEEEGETVDLVAVVLTVIDLRVVVALEEETTSLGVVMVVVRGIASTITKSCYQIQNKNSLELDII
jgi:hypothetical protein